VSLAFGSDLRRPLPAAGDAFDETRVLGGALVGDPSASRSPWPWPVQAVLAPVLGDTRDSVQERWTADGECQAGEFKGIAFRRSRDILFGVIELDEHAFSAAGETRSLQAATEEAYRRIFQLLAAQDLPHLWRVWNYLADINRDTNGLERYRQFNIGRYDAFVAFDRAATGNVPAACTIGLRQGRLSVAFIAGRLAGRPVENPRQVSAYHYPAEYGPRSPTFSRAVLVTLPGQASAVHLRDGQHRRAPDRTPRRCRRAKPRGAGQCRGAHRRGQAPEPCGGLHAGGAFLPGLCAPCRRLSGGSGRAGGAAGRGRGGAFRAGRHLSS
jgi:hypothetical protein